MSKQRELSPDEFRNLVRERRRSFMQAWKRVKDDGIVFQKQTIRAEHCDRLHASLPLLESPTQELEQLFESLSSLPIGVITYRYDLLMALHSVNDIVRSLPITLLSFRSMCNTHSWSATRHLQAIQRKLEECRAIR